jgi:biotin carboxyl carrier protein
MNSSAAPVGAPGKKEEKKKNQKPDSSEESFWPLWLWAVFCCGNSSRRGRGEGRDFERHRGAGHHPEQGGRQRNTKAKDSAAITLSAGGTVVDVYVKEGDYVAEGQELYRIQQLGRREAVVTARTARWQNGRRSWTRCYKELGELTVRAPFSGQLRSVGDI